MKRVIWQYSLPNSSEEITLAIPCYAEILSVGTDKKGFQLWVLVEPNNEIEYRKFKCYVNCQTLTDNNQNYVASVKYFNVWWHIFELDCINDSINTIYEQAGIGV